MFGSIINSQQKTQVLYFDCADINFTDGLYLTSLVLPNNSVTGLCNTKFFQDTSAYPLIVFALIADTAAPQTHILDFNTPYPAGTVNVYENQTTGNITCINNNNCSTYLRITGLTGSGVTSLSGQIVVQYFEIDK
jgi:hypothetical protein